MLGEAQARRMAIAKHGNWGIGAVDSGLAGYAIGRQTLPPVARGAVLLAHIVF